MTIDQVIALAASIGACLSAIAAFFAVRQNSKQREASYRPELALTRSVFLASKSQISKKEAFAKYWSENGEEKDQDATNSSFSLSLRNVGLGAAKEVTLTWSFLIDELVTIINNKAQKLLIPAYFEYENGLLSLNSELLNASTSVWRNQKQASVDYVLPASSDAEGVRVNVPHAYIELVSALIYFSAKEKDYEAFPDMPKLKLDLEYFDIGGAKNNTSFEIELNIMMIYGDGEGFRAYMQSKKAS